MIRDPVHAALIRGRLESHDDTDGVQRITARGLRDSTFGDVLRLQPFGFSSTPPKGSVGLILAQSGAAERAFALGFEHEDHRPRSQPIGGTVLYDASGQAISIVNRTIRIVGGDLFHLSAATIVLDGVVKLGSPGADKPAAMLGSIDTDGDAQVSNLATRVFVT